MCAASVQDGGGGGITFDSVNAALSPSCKIVRNVPPPLPFPIAWRWNGVGVGRTMDRWTRREIITKHFDSIHGNRV